MISENYYNFQEPTFGLINQDMKESGMKTVYMDM